VGGAQWPRRRPKLHDYFRAGVLRLRPQIAASRGEQFQ